MDTNDKKRHSKDFVGVVTNKRLGSAVLRNRARRKLVAALQQVEMNDGIYVFGITRSKLKYIDLKEEVSEFFESINRLFIKSCYIYKIVNHFNRFADVEITISFFF